MPFDKGRHLIRRVAPFCLRRGPLRLDRDIADTELALFQKLYDPQPDLFGKSLECDQQFFHGSPVYDRTDCNVLDCIL
jgi:hypothetical protein